MVECHLKDMILKHFDPKKADSIFTAAEQVCCRLFQAKSAWADSEKSLICDDLLSWLRILLNQIHNKVCM